MTEIKSLYKCISRHKNRGRIIRYSKSRDFYTLNTNIKSKPILIKLLGHKLIVNKDTLKPKINRDIN